MWWLPWTSGYSYPKVAVIQIDVHPTGINPTNTTHTLPTLVHVHPAYASCGWSPYVATFCETLTDLDISHCTLADRSVGTYPTSLPSQPMKQGRKSSSCRWRTTRFTGLISPACDQYVQYLLTGVNPSVLNRHKRGLQPWRYRLSTYHSLTFPTSCLPFPLKAPPDLRLSTQPLPTELEREHA
jgi:hypothetical protein